MAQHKADRSNTEMLHGGAGADDYGDHHGRVMPRRTSRRGACRRPRLSRRAHPNRGWRRTEVLPRQPGAHAIVSGGVKIILPEIGVRRGEDPFRDRAQPRPPRNTHLLFLRVSSATPFVAKGPRNHPHRVGGRGRVLRRQGLPPSRRNGRPKTARTPAQPRPTSIGWRSLDLRPSRHQGCCCGGANWVSDRDTVVFRGVACLAILDR
jgi:hypothetical protein